MQVDVIEKGTVVDHIKAGKGEKVLKLLAIGEDYPYRVALVMNVASKKTKKKDIVKIAEKMITEDEANIIALVSPGATINIIEGGKVKDKYVVGLPEKLEGTGTCPNPNCITGSEHDVTQMFSKEGERYRCHYCERLFKPEELV